MTVWLVIASYRNDTEVLGILERAQALTPQIFERILVVDSDATGELPGVIEARGWDRVEYRAYDHNLGSGANLEVRLRLAAEGGADYAYALNHDGSLDPHVVTSMLAVAQATPHIGAVYPLGYLTDVAKYNVTGTRELPLPAKLVRLPPSGVLDVHWGSSNGALYSLVPIRAGVSPWPAMWMGWEDLEFGWRLADHGYRQVLACDAVFRDNYEYTETRLGAIARKPAWRSYYHIRNLILAVRRSRPRLSFYGVVAARWLIECGLILFVRGEKLERLRLLVAGTRDGLTTSTRVEMAGRPLY